MFSADARSICAKNAGLLRVKRLHLVKRGPTTRTGPLELFRLENVNFPFRTICFPAHDDGPDTYGAYVSALKSGNLSVFQVL